MNKKRINIYVDSEMYDQFKRATAISGDTITAVINHAMKEYVEAINLILETKDKDKLFEMMYKKMKKIEDETN